METTRWGGGIFVTAKKAVLLFVSLLFLASFSFSNHFVNTALAAEKTDTVTGTITLSIESDVPVGPADPSNPGDDPIVDPSAPSSDDVAQVPSAIQDLLAKTGDALPYVALLLVFAGVAVAGVLIVSRKKATQAGSMTDNVSNFSNVQKIAAVLLVSLLVAGTAFAFNKAIADDSADIPATTADTSIATAIGKITVGDDGSVKSASVSLKNNLKSALTVSKFSVDAGSDIANLVNDQFTAGEQIASGDVLDKTWTPTAGTISSDLLAKLNAATDKTLSYDLTVDVAYNAVKVEFATNDGTDTIFDTQEVAEGGNAALPDSEPTYSNHEFKSWNTTADGAGESVDAAYLAANAVSADTKFYAKWSGPQVFLAAKSDDKSLPCKIFSGEDTTTAIKTIDEVKTVATTLKDGGANPDATVYNATSDAWHLFVKISGDGSQVNDWMECRIIQTGKHDTEDNGLTFQAIHALPNKVTYDSTYTDATGATAYTGNWETSTLRTYLNTTFKATLPTSLSSSLATATKLSNKTAGERPVADKVAVTTQDQLWILSFTELVKNAGTKSSTGWGAGSDSHDGSTYAFWDSKDLVTGSTPSAETEQAKLFLALNSDRAGALIPYNEGQTLGFSWQRSVSPYNSSSVLVFNSGGNVNNNIGVFPFRERCVAPSFSL